MWVAQKKLPEGAALGFSMFFSASLHPSPSKQWIGFVGKIETGNFGNHRFSHEDHGAFRFQIFPTKPIH
jgi:hypothetical protein